MSDRGQVKRQIECTKFMPVAFILTIVFILWYIYTFMHCIPLLQLDKDVEHRNQSNYNWGIAELVVFNVIFLMWMINYVLCIITPPGGIPDTPEWKYCVTQVPGETVDTQLETKSSGDRRHCKWCAQFKPDRCHHCRVCRTCVLKMDHHCPWIYNCVGHGNHKYFFLLLFYSVILTQVVFWTMFSSVHEALASEASSFQMFSLLFGETLDGIIAVMILAFFGFHTWLSYNAITTIEFCEKQLKKSGFNSSVYNRGCYGNIQEVLGPNPLLWLLPVSPPSGDGLSFVTEKSRLNVDIEAGQMIRSKHSKTARKAKRKSSREQSLASGGSGGTPFDTSDGALSDDLPRKNSRL